MVVFGGKVSDRESNSTEFISEEHFPSSLKESSTPNIQAGLGEQPFVYVLDIWQLVNDEPAERLRELVSLNGDLSNVMRRSDQEVLTTLVSVLEDIVFGDEILYVRHLAAHILVQILFSSAPSDFSEKEKRESRKKRLVRYLVDELAQCLLFETGKRGHPVVNVCYQDNTTLSVYCAKEKEIEECILLLLGALGHTFPAETCWSEESRLFIDAIFYAILWSSHTVALQGLVLGILASSLPRTNRNRQRIHKFLKCIHGMIREEQWLDPIVAMNLSRFISVWYPRPIDGLLENFALPTVLEGYSERRYTALHAQHSPTPGVKEIEQGHFGWQQQQKQKKATPHVVPSRKLQLLHQERKAKRGAVLLVNHGNRYSLHRGGVNNAECLDWSSSSEDEEYPESSVEALGSVYPEKTILSLGVPSKKLVFDSGDAWRVLTLRNRNRVLPVDFRIQVEPNEYFAIHPAFGVVSAGSSLSLKLVFSPDFRGKKREMVISGFIRLRSQFGFPLERVSLFAYHGPWLHVLTQLIDCGCTLKGRPIANGIALRSTATLSMHVRLSVVDPSQPFRLLPSELVMSSKQTRVTYLLFEPTAVGKYETSVVFTGILGESYSVPVIGLCQSSLEMAPRILDFGNPLLHEPAMLSLQLRNIDPLRPLPVSFLVNCNSSLRVPSVVVPPGTSSKLEVELLSGESGSISGSLIAQAPNSSDIKATISAFVGPFITGLARHAVVMKPTVPDKAVTSTITLVNRSNHLVVFSVNLGEMTKPFGISFGPGIVALPSEKHATKQFSFPAHTSEEATIRLSVPRTGMFFHDLQLEALRPVLGQNWKISLIGLSLPPFPDIRVLRSFCLHPLGVSRDIQDIPEFSEIEAATGSRPTAFPNLTFSTKALVVSSRHSLGAEVQLKNESPVSVTYSVLTSKPYDLGAGMSSEGNIAPGQSQRLTIAPIKKKYGIVYGFLLVVCNQGSWTAVTLTSEETRIAKTTLGSQLGLPECPVDDSVESFFAIENISSSPLRWHSLIEEAPNFSVVPSKGEINPYCSVFPQIKFHSTIQGQYTSTLSLMTASFPKDGEETREKVLATCHLSCVSYHPYDLKLGCVFLEFGSCLLGLGSLKQELEVSNVNKLAALSIKLQCEAPFRVLGDDMIRIDPASTLKITVLFAPLECGFYSRYLTVSLGALVQRVLLNAFAGKSSLLLN